jgi:hypothetical protein
VKPVEWIDYLTPVFREHRFWVDFNNIKKSLRIHELTFDSLYNGYENRLTTLSKSSIKKFREWEYDGPILKLNEVDKKYLLKTRDLVKSNNGILVLVMAPFYQPFYQKSNCREFIKECRKFSQKNDLIFIDLNEERSLRTNPEYFLEENNIDYNQHSSAYGSVVATLKLCDELYNREKIPAAAIPIDFKTLRKRFDIDYRQSILHFEPYLLNLQNDLKIVFSGNVYGRNELRSVISNLQALGFKTELFSGTAKEHVIAGGIDLEHKKSIFQVKRLYPYNKIVDSNWAKIITSEERHHRHEIGESISTYALNVNELAFTLTDREGIIIDRFILNINSPDLKIDHLKN